MKKKSSNFQILCKHLMGQSVFVRLKNGKIYSGIFHKFNLEDPQKFSFVLKMCREKDDILTYPRDEQFSSNDFAELSVPQLTYDFGGGFMTDTEITGKKVNTSGPRELKPWKIEEKDEALLNAIKPLEDDEDADFDQFEYNKNKFGVESTYSEDFYTTKVDRTSKAYLENKQKYAEIEAKIYNEVPENPHIAEERGQMTYNDSEESKYSSVQREETSFKEVEIENNQKSKNIFRVNINQSEVKNNNNMKKSNPTQKNKNGIQKTSALEKDSTNQKREMIEGFTKFSKEIEAKKGKKKKNKVSGTGTTFKLNTNAQEFKPSFKSLSITIPPPPISPMHPPERRPILIDFNKKISSIYHLAQQNKDKEIKVEAKDLSCEWTSIIDKDWKTYDKNVPDIVETKKEEFSNVMVPPQFGYGVPFFPSPRLYQYGEPLFYPPPDQLYGQNPYIPPPQNPYIPPQYVPPFQPQFPVFNSKREY